jgi:NADH-quinone oxidoreductase subunit L
MPKTTITFGIGTGALMAVVPLSGFWSKEQILEVAHHHSPLLFWIAAAVAVLTPFYMMRLFVVAFLGKAKAHGTEKAKEVPTVMLAPLIVLAVMAVLSGFGFVASRIAPAYHPHAFDLTSLVFWVSLGALVIGAGLGFVLYKDRTSDPLAHNSLFKVFRNKFYLDEIYLKLVKLCQDTVAAVVHFIDELLINGLIVGGLARSAGGMGNLFRRLQSGNLQAYALLFGAGILLVIYLTVFAR